jgi:hypothetical protein
MSIPLSLSQLTWALEEVPPANSRRAFALLQVKAERRIRSCHVIKQKITSTVWRRLWELFNRSYKKKKKKKTEGNLEW